MSTPTPQVVDDFLGEEACRRIVNELRFAWWQDSVVVNRDGLGDLVSFRSRMRYSRTAQQEYFPAELAETLSTLETRLRDDHTVDPVRLEPWQAVDYEQGGHFGLHHDSGLFAGEPAGERRRTVLIYLSTPADGGETEFPELELVIPARLGRLVLWHNLDADGGPDPRLRHRAMPVLSGHKTVLTTWEHERPVRPALAAATTKGDGK